jgi:glycosyltransferase involved in cell wall biosynthesis
MQFISIVLCTFNGARFLDAQMSSLCAQEGVDEIVIVDDHSTDDSMAILQDYAAADGRVRVYWNERQLGIVRNFERAIGLARGDWIALSDQDDVWLPQKLRRLRNDWDGQACLIHHASRKFRGAVPCDVPSPAGERRKFSGRDLRRLLYRNSIVGHATLVRADVARQLLPFPSDVPHDWWIGVGAATLGTVQYVDEYLVNYRIHECNAYHPAGSRIRRMRFEHELRLNFLNALIDRRDVAEPIRDFARQYRSRLLQAREEFFSWRLGCFYWAYAPIFFGSVHARSSWMTCARKTVLATLGAYRPAEVPTATYGPQPKVQLFQLIRRRWIAALSSCALCAAVFALAPWSGRIDRVQLASVQPAQMANVAPQISVPVRTEFDSRFEFRRSRPWLPPPLFRFKYSHLTRGSAGPGSFLFPHIFRSQRPILLPVGPWLDRPRRPAPQFAMLGAGFHRRFQPLLLQRKISLMRRPAELAAPFVFLSR